MVKRKNCIFATDLKQVTIILFALLIAFQPLGKVLIVVTFKINQKEIAKTLCVKKDIKNNTCRGKCHLKKQIDKADEQEKKQTPTTQKEQVDVLFCYNVHPLTLNNNAGYYETKKLYAYENNFFVPSFLTDIFHPPEKFLFV